MKADTRGRGGRSCEVLPAPPVWPPSRAAAKESSPTARLPRGPYPTSERRLQDIKCEEFRWSDRANGWEVLIPSVAYQAYYAPVTDHIQMPPFVAFRDAASHAAVEGHEHIHWTAAPNRVGRDLSRYARDRTERAREELIAEVGSCLLCADPGVAPELEPRPDHASYLHSWLSILGGDKRAIFQAAAHAQRAVNFLHSLQPAQDQMDQAA